MKKTLYVNTNTGDKVLTDAAGVERFDILPNWHKSSVEHDSDEAAGAIKVGYTEPKVAVDEEAQAGIDDAVKALQVTGESAISGSEVDKALTKAGATKAETPAALPADAPEAKSAKAPAASASGPKVVSA